MACSAGTGNAPAMAMKKPPTERGRGTWLNGQAGRLDNDQNGSQAGLWGWPVELGLRLAIGMTMTSMEGLEPPTLRTGI